MFMDMCACVQAHLLGVLISSLCGCGTFGVMHVHLFACGGVYVRNQAVCALHTVPEGVDWEPCTFT